MLSDMPAGRTRSRPQPPRKPGPQDKLSIVVQIDVDCQHVILGVTGVVTEANQQALVPLVHRARILFPEATVTVDLRRAGADGPGAVELLRWGLEDVPAGGPSVLITVPEHFGDGGGPVAAA